MERGNRDESGGGGAAPADAWQATAALFEGMRLARERIDDGRYRLRYGWEDGEETGGSQEGGAAAGAGPAAGV